MSMGTGHQIITAREPRQATQATPATPRLVAAPRAHLAEDSMATVGGNRSKMMAKEAGLYGHFRHLVLATARCDAPITLLSRSSTVHRGGGNIGRASSPNSAQSPVSRKYSLQHHTHFSQTNVPPLVSTFTVTRLTD